MCPHYYREILFITLTIILYKNKTTLTLTSDSVSSVTRVTRAVERSEGICTIGVRVTVMSKKTVLLGNVIREAFVHIWKKKTVNENEVHFSRHICWKVELLVTLTAKGSKTANKFNKFKLLTNTLDPISRVTMVTCAVEWAVSIGAISVSVAVVYICGAFFYVWKHDGFVC